MPFPEGLTPNIPASDYAGDPRAQRIAEGIATDDALARLLALNLERGAAH